MSDHIKLERKGAVLCLTIARPEKKNALTAAMYEAMVAAITAADADAGTRAIVIAGSGGVFTAGNDIADFLSAATAPGSVAQSPQAFITTIATCVTPLVAAIDGLAIGVGTTLMLHCDLVYASPGAKFRMPFVDLALVPEAASSLLLPQRIGMAKASEFLMLGEGFDAVEALRLGLVNAIVEPELLMAHACAMAEKLAAKPAAALAATRRLLRGDVQQVAARIETEMQAFRAAMQSPEARRIFSSFLNKSKG